MRLYLTLAWRNIWRHRRRTLIVVLAMALGLSMMMMYDGLMAGFEQGIYGNAIKVMGGNIQIHAEGYQLKASSTPLLPLADEQALLKAVLSRPEVVAASRRINTGGLATSKEGAFSVSIIGMEPEKELPVNLVEQHVSSGRLLTATDGDMVFIGNGLAVEMGLKVGDRMTLVGQATHKQMRQRTMTVAGIYDVGMPDIEKRTVYISLKEAQDLYDFSGQSSEIVISLQHMGQEAAVTTPLKAVFENYEINSWETNFPELKQAIESKNSVMDIFSVIIMVIAGIGIYNLMMMAVYERTREIGLMGAMGMKPRNISALFMLEGTMMGIVGVTAGIALGLIFNGILRSVGLDFSAYSSMTSYMALLSGKVYPSLGLEKLALRGLTVLIIAVLASFYPAREASMREPAEALHYV